ncbi:Hypothetical predicted protein [Pelobates cultripes]|uniref:Uncharacterized protein n=1 Tax=Pelobates cultripes TaxID=61616 RepID=A0AAD1RV38_PELCU|nr:Hypothetical predicted protein [Pelobates cultripes]
MKPFVILMVAISAIMAFIADAEENKVCECHCKCDCCKCCSDVQKVYNDAGLGTSHQSIETPQNQKITGTQDGTYVENQKITGTQDGTYVENQKITGTQDGTYVENQKITGTQDVTTVQNKIITETSPVTEVDIDVEIGE